MVHKGDITCSAPETSVTEQKEEQEQLHFSPVLTDFVFEIQQMCIIKLRAFLSLTWGPLGCCRRARCGKFRSGNSSGVCRTSGLGTERTEVAPWPQLLECSWHWRRCWRLLGRRKTSEGTGNQRTRNDKIENRKTFTMELTAILITLTKWLLLWPAQVVAGQQEAEREAPSSRPSNPTVTAPEALQGPYVQAAVSHHSHRQNTASCTTHTDTLSQTLLLKRDAEVSQKHEVNLPSL